MKTDKAIEKAVEEWSKQGRTEEQIYGVKNFVTSGPFLKTLREVREDYFKKAAGYNVAFCSKCKELFKANHGCTQDSTPPKLPVPVTRKKINKEKFIERAKWLKENTGYASEHVHTTDGICRGCGEILTTTPQSEDCGCIKTCYTNVRLRKTQCACKHGITEMK